ncbi:hypothetical protein [Leeuwenhoekiella sp. H156]|uniref:hypothetical protein n=1 Tax=Leeuwenhoekiella sp. H156 TaxID=3450128 RepID=UPI003FA4053C
MEKKDIIEVRLKILALIGALISFFYGIYKYQQVNDDNSSKAFWEQQFPIYKELCENTAIIAVTNDSIKSLRATENFWRMYYGEARMVVDWQVHEKMSNYASILKDVERGFKNKQELKVASYELATECRKSISTSWDIPLSELKTE